jgi:hypothetical protein
MSFGLLDFGWPHNEGRRKNSQLYKRAIGKVVSRLLPLAMGDNVARQMSSGHSQIRVSRNDRCEYAPWLTKQCKSAKPPRLVMRPVQRSASEVGSKTAGVLIRVWKKFSVSPVNSVAKKSV